VPSQNDHLGVDKVGQQRCAVPEPPPRFGERIQCGRIVRIGAAHYLLDVWGGIGPVEVVCRVGLRSPDQRENPGAYGPYRRSANIARDDDGHLDRLGGWHGDAGGGAGRVGCLAGEQVALQHSLDDLEALTARSTEHADLFSGTDSGEEPV
jgi:hypothetical protein